MSTAYKALAIRDVLEIRKAQLVSAEIHAQEAKKHVLTLRAVRMDHLKALATARTCWKDSLGAKTFTLLLAQGWAVEIQTIERAVLDLNEKVTRAERHELEATLHWRAAQAHCDAVQELTRITRRMVARKHEERTLQSTADLLTSRPA